MTMVYCQTCGEDVHITADCVTNDRHSVVTPPGLRGPVEPEGNDE